MPVNDWIAAARAGARGLIDAHGVIRDSSPKYGETYRTNMNARASEQIAQLKARENLSKELTPLIKMLTEKPIVFVRLDM